MISYGLIQRICFD